MSDIALLLVLVALNLLFASALVVVRLGAVGWSAKRVWIMIAEMWIVFGLFIGMFSLLAAETGEGMANGPGAEAELAGFAARFAHLAMGAKIVFLGGLVLTIVLFFHMLITLNRRMHKAPPEQ